MQRPNILYILSFFVILLISCSSESDGVCYSFDQKQCQSDPWSQSDISAPLQDRVVSYLASQNIDPLSIDIDDNFHTVTCLACDVCPDGPRIFIQIRATDQSKIESLYLLDLMEGNCS